MIKPKIIGWVSCGTTSAIACKLALQQYGHENVELYYIHIDSAHSDNKRFISDLEKWYDKKINIVKSKKYADQFEVIEGTGQVNSAYGAACTTYLKKQVRFEVQRQYEGALQIFGFEFAVKEINRAVRFSQQYPEANGRYPLIENKITKVQCADILLKNGIQLPAMYLMGYNNNNCIGCVKGKKGYWNKIRVDFPEVFAQMALTEREANHSCIKKDIWVNREMTDAEYLQFQKDVTDSDKTWVFDEQTNLHTDHRGQIGNVVEKWWIRKQDGIPLFLDELKPNDGRKLKPVVPDCGSLCEIKFTEIIDGKTKEIFKNSELITTLYSI